MRRKHGPISNQADSDMNSQINSIIIKVLWKDRSIPDTTREERIVSSTNYSDKLKSLSDNNSLFRLLDAMSEKNMEMNKKRNANTGKITRNTKACLNVT